MTLPYERGKAMTLTGKGVFVAWFDADSTYEPEFDHWHSFEHMAERVVLPGFRSGQRYVALSNSPKFCVIYQTDDLATLVSAPYLQVLNNPTPWTQRMMPAIRGLNRTLCTVSASFGGGFGAYLLTLQLAAQPQQHDGLRSWLTHSALPELAKRPGLTGAHLLHGDRAASQTRTKEKEMRGDSDAIADWVVLVEGYDRTAVEGVGRAELSPAALQDHGAADKMTSGLYQLVHLLIDTDGAPET
jgi:hypothetical protein